MPCAVRRAIRKVKAKQLDTRLEIRWLDEELLVDAAWSQHGAVDFLRTVRGRHHQNPPLGTFIELRQKLVDHAMRFSRECAFGPRDLPQSSDALSSADRG